MGESTKHKAWQREGVEGLTKFTDSKGSVLPCLQRQLWLSLPPPLS